MIEGEVRDRGDSYAIRTKTGMTIEVRKDEVLKVEKTDSPLQIYEKRLKALEPDDARGHYDLALWCIENRFEKEAKQLLSQVVGMASPLLKDAKLKLARLLEKSDPRRAIKLYDDVAFRFNDADAGIKARDLRRVVETRRSAALESAMQALAAGKLTDARSELEYAYEMTVGSGGRGTGEMDVLEKLAEVRAKIEEAAAGSGEKAASAQTVEFCGQCPGCSGWTTCYRCSGKGTVERVIPAYRTILGEYVPERRVQDPCPVCRGSRMWRCQGCAGTTVAMANLPRDVQEQVKNMGSVAHGRDHDDFIIACLTMNDIAAGLKLRLPPGEKPRYGTTQPVRDLLRALPVERDFAGAPEYAKVRALWGKLKGEQRALFLCSYTLELTQGGAASAGYLVEASSAAGEIGDLKSLKLTTPVVSATELTAIPEKYDGEWVLTWVVYKGRDEKLSSEDRIGMKVASERFSNLHPFVYTGRARDAHRQLAAGNRTSFYACLASKYDYDGLRKRLDSLADGDRIQIFGRMLAKPGRFPSNLLEVWAMDVRLSPEEEKLLLLVRKPVTFNFSETPVGEVAMLLAALCDTKITTSLPPNARVNLSGKAVRQPLGIALRDLLKDARLAWVFDGSSGIKVVQNPSPNELEKAERILRHLN
ncbi:MAG: zinc finger-like domain-containing protein [Planctomycetota bacterium]|nr:zinc finger-like domain-containing protein [Planctomycetota bacterium]